MTDNDTYQDIPPDVVLPCGCLIRCAIVDGRREMQVTPCRMGCANLANALGLADETDKPVEFRRA